MTTTTTSKNQESRIKNQDIKCQYNFNFRLFRSVVSKQNKTNIHHYKQTNKNRSRNIGLINNENDDETNTSFSSFQVFNLKKFNSFLLLLLLEKRRKKWNVATKTNEKHWKQESENPRIRERIFFVAFKWCGKKISKMKQNNNSADF